MLQDSVLTLNVAKNQDGNDDGEDGDPMSQRVKRVIPYVDDTRNAILITPHGLPDDFDERLIVMASLQAALKTAVQVVFQLEDTELAVEALPSQGDRRVLLMYESAEGGAGVLRRLVEDPDTFSRVAAQALEICHFDSETGEDRRHAPGAKEDCEAGCYDCLLSYYNQPDHRFVDRQTIREILLNWTRSAVQTAPGQLDRQGHLQRLMNQAGSELEKQFLNFLNENGFRLPSRAQVLFTQAGTRPDFLFDDDFTAVYVDGPYHDFEQRHARDVEKTKAMEDLGYSVIRFHHADDWRQVVATRTDVFGEGS